MKHEANRNPTDSREYAARLRLLQSAFWKTLLNVQAPYKWNIRRLVRGTTLDVGCGLGRNLQHLGGRGVGIDRSEYCLAEARSKGLEVFTPDDFIIWATTNQVMFDNVLFAHVLEHMGREMARELLERYIPFLKPGGKVIIISPQHAGFNSDPTHVTYFDFVEIAKLFHDSDFKQLKAYSFPFPSFVGKWFLYNEFVSVWEKSESI